VTVVSVYIIQSTELLIPAVSTVTTWLQRGKRILYEKKKGKDKEVFLFYCFHNT